MLESGPGGRVSGVCSGAVCLLRGCVSALGGVGVYSRGGVRSGVGCGIPTCTEAEPLPPVNRMTNRCKNITLATTSWRPVNIRE